MSEDRVAVKTYVPAYQRETWRDHAENLGMSLSEFLRTMTQAGRRGFVAAGTENAVEESDPGPNPEGQGLEDLILDTVGDDAASWEELVDVATGDVEDRLDDALSRLQEEGKLRYSGRDGGYVRSDR
jgi:hypothetical protein